MENGSFPPELSQNLRTNLVLHPQMWAEGVMKSYSSGKSIPFHTFSGCLFPTPSKQIPPAYRISSARANIKRNRNHIFLL